MQSRRDQVQAHLFVMSRLGAGMLRGEPDALDLAPRRTTRGVRSGLFIAVIIALVMGLYGAIKPGGATGWAKPGTLVVVKETGARYLFVGGELRPVLNQASARLVAGDKMTVTQVGLSSLGAVPRGGPVGIVGAPDGLPAASALDRDDWLVCGLIQATASGRPGPVVAVAVGSAGAGRALGPGQGVLVTDSDGTEHVLWQGRRLRLGAGTGTALGYGRATPFPVAASYLNSLPAGPDLALPEIAGRGTAGPALAGRETRIGQLFTGPDGEPYVLTLKGLAALDRTHFELLRGDPRTQREAYAGAPATAVAVGAADLAAHSAPAGTLPNAGLPATPPKLVEPGAGQGVCTAVRPSADGGPGTLVTVTDAAAVAGRPVTPQPGVTAACGMADLVSVRPGGGALVRALSGAGAAGATYLVADNGVKYPLPTPESVKALGYAGATAMGVPATLLTMLPSGPALDPSALAAAGVVDATVGVPAPVCPGAKS
ncbi:type VII secretion protein EccB [Streptomyces luteolifulvus]|uniref:Type VII secretion protein EccB n=1 Tax=Streptomyces luteolifulvus TaxID=2615112 RepID=A0A6H9UQJ9_9ACTN|nr:type VII secretion protein EccB [Streptomyces luteolifulvus]KAB1140906.1 type VII secretion protein EccB [Streptomyces luteolifulvus]